MNQQEEYRPAVLLPFLQQTNDMSTTAWNQASPNANIYDRKAAVTLNNNERIANVNGAPLYQTDREKGEREDVVNRTRQTNTFTTEQDTRPYVDNTMTHYHPSSSSSSLFNSNHRFFPQARSRTRYEPSYPSIQRFYPSPVRTPRDLDDSDEEIVQEEIIEITNYDHYPTIVERWGDDIIPRIHHEGDLKIEEYIEFEEVEPTVTEEISYEIVYSGEEIQTMREVCRVRSESRNFRKLKKRRVKRKRTAVSQSTARLPLINNGIQVHNIDLIHEQKETNAVAITQRKDENNIEIATQSNGIADAHDQSLLSSSSTTSSIDLWENKETSLDNTEDFFHRDRPSSSIRIVNSDEKSINNLVNEADKQQAETVSTQSATTITLDERLNQHTDDNKNGSIMETTNERDTWRNEDNHVGQLPSDFLVDIVRQIQNIAKTTDLPTEPDAQVPSTSNTNSTPTNGNEIPTDIEQIDEKKTVSDLTKMYYELQEQRHIQSVLVDNLQTDQKQDISNVNLDNQNGHFDIPLFSIRSNLPSREYRQVFGSSEDFADKVNDFAQSDDQKHQSNQKEEREKAINQTNIDTTSDAELSFRYSTLLDRIDVLIEPLIDLSNAPTTQKISASTNADSDQTTALTESIVTNDAQQPEDVQANTVNTERVDVITNEETVTVQKHEYQTTKQSVASNYSSYANQSRIATSEYDRPSTSQQSTSQQLQVISDNYPWYASHYALIDAETKFGQLQQSSSIAQVSTISAKEIDEQKPSLASGLLKTIENILPSGLLSSPSPFETNSHDAPSTQETIQTEEISQEEHHQGVLNTIAHAISSVKETISNLRSHDEDHSVDTETELAQQRKPSSSTQVSSIPTNESQTEEIDETKSSLSSGSLKTIENILPTETTSLDAQSTPETVQTELVSKQEHDQGVLDTIVHAISNVKETISNLRSHDENQSLDVDATASMQEQVAQGLKQSITFNDPSYSSGYDRLCHSQQLLSQQLQVIADNYPWYSSHYTLIDAETKFAQLQKSSSTAQVSLISTNENQTKEIEEPKSTLSSGVLKTIENILPSGLLSTILPTGVNSLDAQSTPGIIQTEVSNKEEQQPSVLDTIVHAVANVKDTIFNLRSHDENQAPDIDTIGPMQEQVIQGSKQSITSNDLSHSSEDDRLSSSPQLSSQQLQVISDNYPWYASHYTLIDAEIKFAQLQETISTAQASTISTNERQIQETEESQSGISSGLLKTIVNILPSGLLSTILPPETNFLEVQSTQETVQTKVISEEKHDEGILDAVAHAISNVKETISNLRSHDKDHSIDTETESAQQKKPSSLAQVSSVSTNESQTKEDNQQNSTLSTAVLKTIENILPSALLSSILPTEANSQDAQSAQEAGQTEVIHKEENHQGVLDTIVHAISSVKETVSNLRSHDENQSMDAETATTTQEVVIPDPKQSIISNSPWYASRYKVVANEYDRRFHKQTSPTIEDDQKKSFGQPLQIIGDQYPWYSNHYTIIDAEAKLPGISTKGDISSAETTPSTALVDVVENLSPTAVVSSSTAAETSPTEVTNDEKHRTNVTVIPNVKDTTSSLITHDGDTVEQINRSNESSTSSEHSNIVDPEEKSVQIKKTVNVHNEQWSPSIIPDKQLEVQNVEDNDENGFRVVQRRKRIPSSTTHDKTTTSTTIRDKPVLSPDIDLKPVVIHGNPNAVVPIPTIISSTNQSSSKKKHKKKKNDKKEMILFDAPEPELSQTLANERNEEIIVSDQKPEAKVTPIQPAVPAISKDQKLSTNLPEHVEIDTTATEQPPAETVTKVNISPLSLATITRPKQEKAEVEEEDEDNEGFQLVRYHKRTLFTPKSDRTPPVTPTSRETPDFRINESMLDVAQHQTSPKKTRNKHKKQKKEPHSISNTDSTDQIEQETLEQPSEAVESLSTVPNEPNPITIPSKSIISPKKEKQEQEDEDNEGFQVVTYRKRITSAPRLSNTHSSPVTHNRYERNIARNVDSHRFDLHGRHGSASPSILRTAANKKTSTNQQKEVKFMENRKQTTSLNTSPRSVSIETRTPTTVNSTTIDSQKSEQYKNETVVDVKVKSEERVIQEEKTDSLPATNASEASLSQTKTQKKKSKPSNDPEATPLSIEATTDQDLNDNAQSISSPAHEQADNANAVTLVNTTTSEAVYEPENAPSPSYSILSIPSTTTAMEEVSTLSNDIPTAVTSNRIEDEVSTGEHAQSTSNKKRRKKKPQNKAKSNDEEPSTSTTQNAATTPSNTESKWPTISNSYTSQTSDQLMNSLSPTSKSISKEMNNKLDLFLPEYIREQIDTPSTTASSEHIQKKKPRLKMLKKDPEAKSLLTNEFDTEQESIRVNTDDEGFVVPSEEKTLANSTEQTTDNVLSRGFHIWLQQSQAVSQPKKSTINVMQSIIIQPVRTTEDDEDDDGSNTSKATNATYMIGAEQKKKVHVSYAYSINHPESNTTPSWLISQSNDKTSDDSQKNFEADHTNDSTNDKSTEQAKRSSNSTPNRYQGANSASQTMHQNNFDDWAHFLDIKNSYYLGNDLPTSLECFYTQTVDEETLLSNSIPIQQSIPNQYQRYGDFSSDSSDTPITKLPLTQSKPSHFFHNARRQEVSSIENQTNDDDNDEIFISHSINGLSQRLRP